MYLKGMFAGLSAVRQIGVLLLLVLFGSIISSIISLGLFWLIWGFDASIYQTPDGMRLVQFFSAVGTFLFPAIAFSYLCTDNWKSFLSISKSPGVEVSILVIISMFLLSPVINLTAMLNQSLELPEWMSEIENWMITQEENAKQITDILLGTKGIVPFISNIIVIALTAAVTEEMLFRGALSNALAKFSISHHAVIWMSAILFSAFHLQFYGFIPRMLLGAYFGYLLLWSKNMWLPIIAHFTNNATAVIGMSCDSLKNNEYITGEISDQHLTGYIVTGIAFLFLFYMICIRIKSSTSKD